MEAGQKWQGLDTKLMLTGWKTERRVIVLRRVLRDRAAKGKDSDKKAGKQLNLDLPQETYPGILYAYALLVTSLKDEVRTIAQHWFPVYGSDTGQALLELASQALSRPGRFGEQLRRVENQWGWAGFTRKTRSAAR
jgi:hypothetical protein